MMYLDTLHHGDRNLPEYKCDRKIPSAEKVPYPTNEWVPSPNATTQNDLVSMSRSTTITNHPFFTHMSVNSVFPPFTLDRPCSVRNGYIADPDDFRHGECPKRPLTAKVIEKSRGGRFYHEVLPCDCQPRFVDHNWIEWPAVHESHQVPADRYPIPPKLHTPNDSRPRSSVISCRQLEVLQNIEKEQRLTTYTRDFAGYGPMGVLNLDNWEEKRHAYLAEGHFDDELRPVSKPRFDPTKCSLLSPGTSSALRPKTATSSFGRQQTISASLCSPFNPAESWTPQYRRFDSVSTETEGEDIANKVEPNLRIVKNIVEYDDDKMKTTTGPTDIYQNNHQNLDYIESLSYRNPPASTLRPFVTAQQAEAVSKHATPQCAIGSNRTVSWVKVKSDAPMTYRVDERTGRVDLESLAAAFDKTAMRKDFVNAFHRNAPDLRDHIATGKRHTVNVDS